MQKTCFCLLSLICMLQSKANAALDPANDYFKNPGTPGENSVYATDQVWTIDSIHEIQWATTLDTYTMVLHQEALSRTTAFPLNSIYSINGNGAGDNKQFSWTVQTYASDLSTSPIYFLWINAGDEDATFTSHYFNLTNTPTSSSSTPAPASSTQASTKQTGTSSSAASSNSDSDSTVTKIGLGVGLGIGIPLVLIAGIWVVLESTQFGGQVPLSPASTSTDIVLSSTTYSTSIVSVTPAYQASYRSAAFDDTPLAASFTTGVDKPALEKTLTTSLSQSNDTPARATTYDTDLQVSNTTNDTSEALMKTPGRKCFGGFLAIALGYITISGAGSLFRRGPSQEQEWVENREWVASSKSWINKQLCQWLGLCGISHLNRKGWTWDNLEDEIPPAFPDISDWWVSGSEDPSSWSDKEKARREIPQYVFEHAPYVHLFSGEHFWPCDLAEHLIHTSPHVNYTKVGDPDGDRNLTNLDELNDWEGSVHGRFMYLQSDDNVEERPKWLGGRKNIPTTPEIWEEEDDNELAWPNLSHQKAFDTAPGSSQESVEDEHDVEYEARHDQELQPPSLVSSTNGRCGGNSGFTCKRSKFGKCCSIYGWCGTGNAYCGDSCDPLSGECNDPFEPFPKPRSDLRRRQSDLHAIKHQPNQAGRSSAPAVLVVVPKEDGVVDAFWFFFYSFNQGQKVFGIRFGNHIGDWEHTLIRFKDGKPRQVFMSEHNFGDAYDWHALEKYLPDPEEGGRMIGSWSNRTAARKAKRPVMYSAVGTHAMYATPGVHPYVLPWGILHDQTDRGPLWDPALNLQAYTWDLDTSTLRASTRSPKAPVEWFHYAGHWGDKFYPLSDRRQYRFAGQYHYVNGPTGPRFKNLHRKHVCQRPGECHIRHWAKGGRARTLPVEDDVEEGGLPGGNYTNDDWS